MCLAYCKSTVKFPCTSDYSVFLFWAFFKFFLNQRRLEWRTVSTECHKHYKCIGHVRATSAELMGERRGGTEIGGIFGVNILGNN